MSEDPSREELLEAWDERALSTFPKTGWRVHQRKPTLVVRWSPDGKTIYEVERHDRYQWTLCWFAAGAETGEWIPGKYPHGWKAAEAAQSHHEQQQKLGPQNQ